MTTAQMRASVHEAYSGNGWGHKVDNMSDIQVQAVYFSLLERGMFNKPPNKKQSTSEQPKSIFDPAPSGEQLSFF